MGCIGVGEGRVVSRGYIISRRVEVFNWFVVMVCVLRIVVFFVLKGEVAACGFGLELWVSCLRGVGIFFLLNF